MAESRKNPPRRGRHGHTRPPGEGHAHVPPKGNGSPPSSGLFLLVAVAVVALGIVLGRSVIEAIRNDGGASQRAPAGTSTPDPKAATRQPPERTPPTPTPPVAAPANPTPFLDDVALERWNAVPDALADYKRAATMATTDNSKGSTPLLERLANRDPDAPYQEEVLALRARAAATSPSPDRAVELASQFRRKYPKSRYLDQVLIAEARAQQVLGRRAFGDADPETGDPLPAEATRRLQAALDAYQRAARSKDQDAAAEAAMGMAVCHSMLGQKEQASAAWKRAADQFHGDPRAPKALAAAAADAWKHDDVDAARSLLDELMKRFPSAREATRARSDRAALDVVGRPAPGLQVKRWMNGAARSLADLRGKTVLLVFWATWCPHCREEMPHVIDAWKQFHDDGLEVIAVTRHSKGQTDADVEKYIADNDVPFPVAVDDSGQTSTRYGVSGIPAAALVDKTGTVVWRNHPAGILGPRLASFLTP